VHFKKKEERFCSFYVVFNFFVLAVVVKAASSFKACTGTIAARAACRVGA
jgi:hypothetical protein